MKLLITGSEGQVTKSLAARATDSNGAVVLEFLSRPDFDLEKPEKVIEQVCGAVDRQNIDVIISAAAYTAVDQAEDEPEVAQIINGVAPGLLAEAAKKCGINIIHISTDYVFDGQGDGPYKEDDPVAPLGVYGRTKEFGERAVRAACDEHAIVRTAWVYSPFGNNFVKTMLRLGESREELTVVNDQHGCPTSALDIADGIIAMVRQWNGGSHVGLGETYHLAGTGETSWAGFASAIFEESARHGGPVAQVTGIPSSEYPTKAERPANSRLECAKLERDFGYRAPDWRVSTADVVAKLLA